MYFKKDRAIYLVAGITDMRKQINGLARIANEKAEKQMRYFIARNSEVAEQVHYPNGWNESGFKPFKAIEEYENRWKVFA